MDRAIEFSLSNLIGCTLGDRSGIAIHIVVETNTTHFTFKDIVGSTFVTREWNNMTDLYQIQPLPYRKMKIGDTVLALFMKENGLFTTVYYKATIVRLSYKCVTLDYDDGLKGIKMDILTTYDIANTPIPTIISIISATRETHPLQSDPSCTSTQSQTDRIPQTKTTHCALRNMMSNQPSVHKKTLEGVWIIYYTWPDENDHAIRKPRYEMDLTIDQSNQTVLGGYKNSDEYDDGWSFDLFGHFYPDKQQNFEYYIEGIIRHERYYCVGEFDGWDGIINGAWYYQWDKGKGYRDKGGVLIAARKGTTLPEEQFTRHVRTQINTKKRERSEMMDDNIRSKKKRKIKLKLKRTKRQKQKAHVHKNKMTRQSSFIDLTSDTDDTPTEVPIAQLHTIMIHPLVYRHMILILWTKY
eukprot:439028_1